MPCERGENGTAGSHTNGGSATQTFRRSMPNRWNIGIEAMAITRMLTSSSVPSTFQAAITQRGTRNLASASASMMAVTPVTMSKLRPE